MFRRRITLTAAALAATSLALAGCTAQSNEQTDEAAITVDLDNLATTTEAGTAPVDDVKWNLPYEPMSLDPQFGYNYAENTVTANLCESLLRMKPDFSVEPGLASGVTQPDDTTVVYTIRDGVTFWDGTPLTVDDVVYSLERQVGETAMSYFSSYFQNVESVEATGANEVTVKLTQPDVLFTQAMATAAGAIVQKAAAEAQGEAFGTPDGGLQCTGPFSLDAWNSGKSIDLAANPEYWDGGAPLASSISFSFIADESTAVNALRTGEVDGQYFYLPPAGLGQLTDSDDVTTTFGDSLVFWTMMTTNFDGGLGDDRIRQALSLAIDREALTKVVFQGAGIPATTLAGPAYWGYEEEKFAKAWEQFSADPDIEEAKQLVAEVGTVDPIVLAVQGSSAVHEQTANVIQAAGQAIGLDIQTKVIPVEQFGNLYFDPAAREGIDGFFTTQYGSFADPTDVYQMFASTDSHNYAGWDHADEAIFAARAETDEAARADHVIDAQQTITDELPWLPLAYEPVTLVQNNRISGAVASFAYLYAPWAATLGGVE